MNFKHSSSEWRFMISRTTFKRKARSTYLYISDSIKKLDFFVSLIHLRSYILIRFSLYQKEEFNQ